MTAIWLILLLTLLTVEMLLTAGEMTAFALAVGTLGGLIAALLAMPVWIQCTSWGLSSLAAMFFLRPLLRRHFMPREEDFTAGSYAGQMGHVLEAIAPHTKGRVKIQGEVWLAESDMEIPANTDVVIVEIEGATLRVLPATELQNRPAFFLAENPPPKSISEGDS